MDKLYIVHYQFYTNYIYVRYRFYITITSLHTHYSQMRITNNHFTQTSQTHIYQFALIQVSPSSHLMVVDINGFFESVILSIPASPPAKVALVTLCSNLPIYTSYPPPVPPCLPSPCLPRPLPSPLPNPGPR